MKKGPVVANNVALAIEVFLTPMKKKAKCSPRLKPANTISFLFEFVKEPEGKARLYPHSIPLALNIRQKAKVKAGTLPTYLMTKDVELTEINASAKTRKSLRLKGLFWEIV